MKTEHSAEVTIPVALMERKGDAYLQDMISMVMEGEQEEHKFKSIEFVDYEILEGLKAKGHPQFTECVTFELKFIVE